MGVSKNAVVGKAHRLELPARPSPIRRAATAGAPPRRADARRTVGHAALPVRLPAAPSEAAPTPGRRADARAARPARARRARSRLACRGRAQSGGQSPAAGRSASPAPAASASATRMRRGANRTAPSMPRLPMSGCATAARRPPSAVGEAGCSHPRFLAFIPAHRARERAISRPCRFLFRALGNAQRSRCRMSELTQIERTVPHSALDADAVRAAYKRWAGVYDTVFGGVSAWGRRRAVAEVNRLPGTRVLEVGVGTGLALPHYTPDKRITGNRSVRRNARLGTPARAFRPHRQCGWAARA